MQLSEFDGQCVRIVDSFGDVFEGICTHNNADYSEHEFGRHEEGLEMPNMLFFKSDIREVTSLEDHQGPYGRFSAPFGRLEELTVEDGIDMIEEMLLSEEPEHIYRLLLCLEDHLKSQDDKLYEESEGLVDLLKNLIGTNEDAQIKALAQRLIAKLPNPDSPTSL